MSGTGRESRRGHPEPDPGIREEATAEQYDPAWLALREPADHASRDRGAGLLLPVLEAAFDRALPAGDRPTVLDLGCGTGSNARWLAPRLTRPQDWVLVDRDPVLLERAAAALSEGPAAVRSVTGWRAGVADVGAADLAGVDLVTASALLDVLTATELDRLVGAVLATRTPLLAALSVTGELRITPPDPADAALDAAFDAHQRRSYAGSRRLGADAPGRAARALAVAGWRVVSADTPWHLGSGGRALLTAWLTGRATAAVDQDPALGDLASGWLARRRAQAEAGELSILVGHRDLLAVPAREA